MYEKHWGLERNPFQNSAAGEFFFRSRTHEAALLKMRYLLERGLGAGLLVGGVGYGKTYLASVLAAELPSEFDPVIHIVFPQFSPSELLAYLAAELGADDIGLGRDSQGLDRTVRQIEKQLTQQTKRKRHTTILIDEAHLIEDRQVWQTLQLLLNFQQRPQIEFSLILIGEPELLAQVQRNTALDDRISVKSILQPLSQEETRGYVSHRMQVAGCTQQVFDATALEAIFELSGGVPRRINRLSDLALLVGYADELPRITSEEIEAVAEELTPGVLV